jgi:hypothetical protein
MGSKSSTEGARAYRGLQALDLHVSRIEHLEARLHPSMTTEPSPLYDY